MSALFGSGVVRGSGSARRRAGARWNACGNENGAGDEGVPGAAIAFAASHEHDNHERRRRCRDELDILIGPR